MKVRWHKAVDPRFGYVYWYAEVDGARVAEARMTSHTGTEDYPWEWFYTDEGEKRRIPGRGSKRTGPEDTLRAVKASVAYDLGFTDA
jgi:hypothetical protein